MSARTSSQPVKAVRSSAKVRSKADPYFAKVIGKALAVLQTVQQSSEALTLNEVVERTGGAKSSVFRILHTLETLGYIQKDPKGRYLLAAANRAVRAPILSDLMHHGLPLLKTIGRELQETATLAALFDNHIEVIAVVESPHTMRMSNMVGRILPPHASSLGKSVAAFQNEERQDHLVRSYGIYRYTGYTILDEFTLKREFERIRADGYSVDNEENTEGGICFGAPIFASGPDAVAALSVSMPKIRLSGEQQDLVIRYVKKGAADLTKHLSGH